MRRRRGGGEEGGEAEAENRDYDGGRGLGGRIWEEEGG